PSLGTFHSWVSLEMEGLGVAAGVAGLLTLAIQSSKVIWETLSGIKEAPADVERLITVVSNLRFLLDQLEELWKKNDLDGGTLSKDFEVVINACAFDLDQFRKQVSRLQASPDKKTWRKTWRSFKSVLEKEKLDSIRMSNTIVLFLDELRTENSKSNIEQRKQLTRLLTDTTTSSQDASSEFHSFTQKCQTATTQNTACLELISKQTANHQANQEASNQASANLRKEIMAMKSNVETGYVEIQKKLETGNVEMEKKLESTSHSLDSLSDTVHRLSIGFSEGQIKTLTSMITSLQSQIPTHGPKDFCPKSQRKNCDARDVEDAEDCGRRDDFTEAGHQLKLSLDRLARIAKDARTIAPSQEARLVLEALETIFRLVVAKASIPDSPNLKRKRADHWGLMKDKEEHGQEQKRIKSLLTASQSVILNPKASGQNRIQPGDRVKRLTRAEVYESPSGTLSIVSMSHDVSNSHHHQEDAEAESSCQHTLQKYAGKATFWTRNTAFSYKISATVVQNLTCNGYHSLKPTLSYHAMMPFESEVFVTVQTGNLPTLKHLLQQGKASLTDCDPAGRSLLSYASYYRHPDICQYLIENGADLDCLERGLPSPEGVMMVPLAYPCFKDFKSLESPEDYIRRKACYRLLVLAGADPLISCQTDWTANALVKVVQRGDPEELNMMLHHAGVVIDPEEPLGNSDDTMLLRLCSTSTGVNFNLVESLRLLLKFGVNVNATDKYGNTAIHLTLRSQFERTWNGYTMRKDFLMLLLQSVLRTGADLHVRNNFGIEASQVAYGHTSFDERFSNFLHQRTQIWNEVLTEFGFDITEFQSCCGGCRCTNVNSFLTPAGFCDSFEKRAYLDIHTLAPIGLVASDDDSDSDVDDDDDDEEDDEYADGEYADEEYAVEESDDSEVEPETYPRPRSQDYISIRGNSQELENDHPRISFEGIESEDENYEEAEEEFETPLWQGNEDNLNGSSSYEPEREENVTPAPVEVIESTNERYSNSEPEPEHYHWPSSHNLISMSNQEPNGPATQSKTFWNVI
ncbi:hypothetical protein MMC22_009257, partial [Lobaria immixta]|nr:hypothetical protein [Lobaria immixta]